MATFLAVYSKSQQIDRHQLEKVIDDFTINNSRDVVEIELPGMLLLVAKKFQKFIYQTENTLSFTSGHIYYETSDENLGVFTKTIFTDLMNKNNDQDIGKLEGVFATVYYDRQTHQLIYANDKFGIMPLFVSEDKEFIILSNEYQPLALFKNNLDYNAIAEFLTLGVTLGTKTFFKRIKNLGPATVVKVTAESTVTKQYWKPVALEKKTIDVDKLAKQMHSLFTQVNQEYVDAKVGELCLLTAGADSRLIISTLNKKQLADTAFYTSNLSLLKTTEDKDVIGACALASKFNLQHTVKKISFYENIYDENYFDKERELRDKHVYGGWHGGEFFGGYSMRFAPINKELTYREINTKFKSIFNWFFRLKVKNHPYKSYREEKLKLLYCNNDLIFQIHQMTRSFFSNIYKGTRGHWVQPFQLMNHGFSPFWDSRILKLLIQIPIEELKDYEFYNKIFKYCNREFTEIPSNSVITDVKNAVIPKMKIGVEPKHNIPNTHHTAYLNFKAARKTWNKRFYNKKTLMRILEDEFGATTGRWLDFEVWYSRYVD